MKFGQAIRSATTGLLLGLACAGAARAAEPILIGAALTLSPPGPVIWGTQIREGMEAAVKIVNDKGGVLGRPLKVIYEDHQGNPERARAATEKLITRDKVSAVTGIELTPAVLASIEVAHRYNVPFINTNGWADAIRERGYPQVFNPNVYVSLAVDAAIEFLQGLGVKRVVGIMNNDDAGISTAKAMQAKLAARNAPFAFEPIHVDRYSKDFIPILLPLKANPPDVVLVSSQQPAAYIIMKQLYEQGIAPSPKTLTFDEGGVADAPDFWKAMGDAGQYLVEYGLYHPKMAMTSIGTSFSGLHETLYKRIPNRLALQAADSIFTIAEGIRLAGKVDSDSIQAALRDAKIEGTRGIISFDKTPGATFQQWTSTPYTIFQFTEVNQPLDKTILISGTDRKVDVSKIVRPK